MNNYAFIPVRGGSKGLPGKNIMEFMGEPLITRAVRIALKTNIFDEVIVNTDDATIADIATDAGASVIIREDEMGSDTAEVDPLIVWTINNYQHQFLHIENSLITLLYCTAPLRKTSDIVATCNLVASGDFDSSLSLCETSDYLWAKDGDVFIPQNYDPSSRAARQTESWNQFKENKAVYCFKAKEIMKSKCRLNGRVGAHLMPETRSIDVDTLNDFKLAESLAINEFY